MSEEVTEYVANRDSLAKRLYEETQNPYWILYSLWITDKRFAPSPWALDALRASAVEAMAISQKGGVLSLDRVMGLKIGRGTTPPTKRAINQERTRWALKFASVIHAVYEVSKELACEIVFHSVDFQFAGGVDFERQERAHNECWQKTKRAAGADDTQWARRVIDAMEEFDNSASNILARKKIWSVTYEQTLGFSLDTFIAKAHRNKIDFLYCPGVEKDANAYFLNINMLLGSLILDSQMPAELGLSRWQGIHPESLMLRADVLKKFLFFGLSFGNSTTAQKQRISVQ